MSNLTLPPDLKMFTAITKSATVNWFRDGAEIVVEVQENLLQAGTRLPDLLRSLIPEVSTCKFKHISINKGVFGTTKDVRATVIEWQVLLGTPSVSVNSYNELSNSFNPLDRPVAQQRKKQQTRKCHCSINTLMRSGCQCGGI